MRCVTWALEKAPVQDPTQVLLLIALADRASDDGTGSWPSAAWLAERARCSVRTVRRHMIELEQAGIIRRGDQRSVQHLRGDRRPVVWDLAMEVESTSRGDIVAPREVTAGQSVTSSPGVNLSRRENPRGDTGGIHGVTAVAHKPSLEPSLVLTPASEPTKVIESHFDEWWTAYPRKAGKGAARKAYARASRLVGHQVLLDAATRYRADPNRSDAYTAHPSTWLNQDRWDDEPLPAAEGRPTRPASSPDAVQDWLRAQWQAGNVKAVEERSGIRYSPGRPPDDITTGAGMREWNLQHRRDWINAHHAEAAAAIAGRVPA